MRTSIGYILRMSSKSSSVPYGIISSTYFTALSCVFRAGRMGALTDHDSVLFDVDPKTGEVLGGTTNAHWYRLGLHEVLPGRCPWRSKDHDITHHPDGNIPVSGSVVPNIREMLHLVETSHWKLCPDVPLVGWDVVLSADEKLPVCLLEVNLVSYIGLFYTSLKLKTTHNTHNTLRFSLVISSEGLLTGRFIWTFWKIWL